MLRFITASALKVRLRNWECLQTALLLGFPAVLQLPHEIIIANIMPRSSVPRTA